jgi:large subunit ribosomal protein L32
MPNPKRKHSHARSATRRTHYTVTAPTLVAHPGHRSNPKCPELIPAHTACPACGIYHGRVVGVKEVRTHGRTKRERETKEPE